MTTSEIQNLILAETGIKTSVKKGRGSNRYHLIFTPMFQGGAYPEFPFAWRQAFIKQFPDKGKLFSSASGTQLHICVQDITPDGPIEFKREKKPKKIQDMKVCEWGSKNSQMRLDKTAARYAKRRRGPNGDNTVKYW